MSYSFSVLAGTKEEVLRKIAAEFDNIVASQPMHANDRQQAQASAEAFLEMITEKTDEQDFWVSISGSVGWNGTPGVDAVITGAGANVSVSLRAKEKQAEPVGD